MKVELGWTGEARYLLQGGRSAPGGGGRGRRGGGPRGRGGGGPGAPAPGGGGGGGTGAENRGEWQQPRGPTFLFQGRQEAPRARADQLLMTEESVHGGKEGACLFLKLGE